MKKLLSVFMSVILILTLFSFNLQVDAKVKFVYYVANAENGGDDDNVGTYEKPLLTINKAMQLIANREKELNIYQDAVIYILNDGIEFDGGISHKGMVTIKGYNATAPLLSFESGYIYTSDGSGISAVVCKGPTTFDNIKFPNLISSGYKYLVSGGYEIKYKNIECDDWQQYGYFFGQTDKTFTGNREIVNIEDLGGEYGTTNSIKFGAFSRKNPISNGMDFIFSGGKIFGLNFLAGTIYKGDVNIVLDNFTIRGDVTTARFNDYGATFEAAFQFIVNNGNVTLFDQTYIANIEKVTAKMGSFVLYSEKSECALKTTETAGTFKVSGGKLAKAVNKYDSTKVYCSDESGLLTVPAGVYNVTYVDAPINEKVYYVDAVNGNDESGNGAIETPFATIKKAEEKFQGENNSSDISEVICVIGTADFDGGITSDKSITIRGYNKESALNLITKWYAQVNSITVLKRPIVFDAISFPSGADSTSIVTNGQEVIIKNGETRSDVRVYCGFVNAKATNEKGQKITVNDFKGTSWGGMNLYCGPFGNNTNKAIGDIDVTVNGSRFKSIRLYPGIYNGNVNITWNTGSFTSDGPYDTKIYNGEQTFKGAFQVISNNNSGTYPIYGTEANETDFSNIKADGGVWYMHSADINGNRIETTEKAGTFKIIGGYAAKATDQNGNTYTGRGTLTVPPGTYNVIYYNSADANLDTKLDIRDLVATKILVLSDDNNLFADVSYNGKVDADDIAIFQKHFLGVNELEFICNKMELQSYYDKQGVADNEADKLKNEIMNSTDNAPQGETYYVSTLHPESKGEGTRENPFTSVDQLENFFRKSKLFDSNTAQQVVLFERGSVFRTNIRLTFDDYTFYGAYGEGPKPKIMGSLRDYADPSLWTTEDGNIWKLTFPQQIEDAGNIIMTKDGVESAALRRPTFEKVVSNGYYYYDAETLTVYLYLEQRNPAVWFDTIEISTSRNLTGNAYNEVLEDGTTGKQSGYNKNITIENIEFVYTSRHIMPVTYAKNFEVRNCMFRWCGGIYASADEGMGNAIEIWNGGENCYIHDNYFDQIYDAPVTFQGHQTNKYVNICFEQNLMERCSFGFEFWAGVPSSENGVPITEEQRTERLAKAVMTDIYFKNNICRFAADGFGGRVRCGPQYTYQSFVQPFNFDATFLKEGNFDVNIVDNIFDTSTKSFFYSGNKVTLELMNISGNKYYQYGHLPAGFVNNDGVATEEEFKNAVSVYDKNATVKWVNVVN